MADRPTVPPVVGLCAGKDCRRGVGFTKMRSALERECIVVDLKCLGLCNGPVVVAQPESNNPVVYSRLRTKRHRMQVLRVIAGDVAARQALAGRQVIKRKAVVAAERQIRRRNTTIRRAA